MRASLGGGGEIVDPGELEWAFDGAVEVFDPADPEAPRGIHRREPVTRSVPVGFATLSALMEEQAALAADDTLRELVPPGEPGPGCEGDDDGGGGGGGLADTFSSVRLRIQSENLRVARPGRARVPGWRPEG